ncbi:hypothetical protein D915_001338 [Fasciola hepatica]|uniref:Uncharacterized protein n=1 Tax=Fasciola hepatica TaxID=6192 RepID=A0A4E0S3Q7_FASHE|nr:hypothetical protein D915_001338 [Fasciola hepatica]
MELTLWRGDSVRLPVLVPLTARVLDLRHAVQDAVVSYLKQCEVDKPSSHCAPKTLSKSAFGEARDLQLHEEPEMEAHLSLRSTSPQFISWRSVWRTQSLAWVNSSVTQPTSGRPSIICKLDNLHMRLLDTGIRNGATISFVNKLKRK